MNSTHKKVAGAVASGALALGAIPAVAVAGAIPAEYAAAPEPGQVQAGSASVLQVAKTSPVVAGSFAWSQGSDSTASLAQRVYEGASFLCGAAAAEQLAVAGPAQVGQSIQVEGDVAFAFTADVAELEKKAPVSKVMGCTCSGNQVDGRATANAAVAGFELKALIEAAKPAEDANTIAFTCADGYTVELPLSYVMQRYSIVVTNVNGAAAEDAIGCTNQLWLGSTAARSFARDVVAINITVQDTPPAAPGAPAAPGISVLEGETA